MSNSTDKIDAERFVRRRELDAMLSKFARLADAAMTSKVATMKAGIVAELRAELTTMEAV